MYADAIFSVVFKFLNCNLIRKKVSQNGLKRKQPEYLDVRKNVVHNFKISLATSFVIYVGHLTLLHCSNL
jgi:hypothetical protein